MWTNVAIKGCDVVVVQECLDVFVPDWMLFGASSGSKIIGSGAEAWGSFIWSLEMVSSFKGRILWSMLEVSMLHSHFPSAFLLQMLWKSEPLVIAIGHLTAKVPSFIQMLSDGLLIYFPFRSFLGANWALL